METIIGLLFILLPMIFKVISRKFEQSGQNGMGGKMKELSEIFDENYTDNPEYELKQETVATTVLDPVLEPFDVKLPAPEKPKEVRSLQKTPALSVRKHSRTFESEKLPRHEKIDPKKLVIYSEIMKPKF